MVMYFKRQNKSYLFNGVFFIFPNLKETAIMKLQN